ncbi:MAG: ComF family protein [Parcubacteria group bacterium]|nr:MAG: ComF family protein [Parcubacteria group bacterium]
MGLKELILDIVFPPSCFVCQREGDYLCQDCKAVLEISGVHKNYSGKNINDLYFALPYQSSLIKDLIKKFKYEPFVKELGKSLSSLIIEHINLIDNKPDFTGFVLVPVPLEKKKLKWRGFNQSEEIGKGLADFLKIPLISDVLIKTKETLDQVNLNDQEREENIKNAFLCQDPKRIKGGKIIIIDDVFTTGSTMEEAAGILKEAGAEKIIGVTVARG